MCFEPGTCQYKKVIGLIDDSADVRGRSILIASPTDINSCNLLLNCKPKRPAARALGPKASAIKPVETLFIYFMLGICMSYIDRISNKHYKLQLELIDNNFLQ